MNKRKNPWWGIECQHCDRIYDSTYSKEKEYALSNGYSKLNGDLMWECGACVKKRMEQQLEEQKKAAKENGSCFAPGRTFW